MSKAPQTSAVVLLMAAGLAAAATVQPPSKNSLTDCGPCLKYRLLSVVDGVLSRAEGGISLAEGVSLVKSPGTGGAPRSLSEEETEKTDLEDLLAERVKRFVSTHTLKMDLRGSDIVDAATNAGRAIGGAVDFLSDLTGAEDEGGDVESARKKVKKAGKMMLPLLMMIKMKMAMMAKLAFAAIALIAGKALIIGKIALLLSVIIAVKKLLSQQQKSVTYEIVPHHHDHHEHHEAWAGSSGGGGDVGGHHGWGRSADELAYRAYQPQQQVQQQSQQQSAQQ